MSQCNHPHKFALSQANQQSSDVSGAWVFVQCYSCTICCCQFHSKPSLIATLCHSKIIGRLALCLTVKLFPKDTPNAHLTCSLSKHFVVCHHYRKLLPASINWHRVCTYKQFDCRILMIDLRLPPLAIHAQSTVQNTKKMFDAKEPSHKQSHTRYTSYRRCFVPLLMESVWVPLQHIHSQFHLLNIIHTLTH